MREKFSWKKRAASFRFAWDGIRYLVANEHNAWIHLAIAVAVVAAGIFFRLSPSEWTSIVLCITTVLAGEGFNTAIEALADRVSPERDEAIRVAKDVAAGAVLLLAAGAVVVGLIIFIPKIFLWLGI